MTSKKSRYHTKVKPKTKNIKFEKSKTKSPLPSNLQSPKQKLLSGKGFILNK